MARYTGPVCRLCRREGQKLFLKGQKCYTEKCAVERRAYPPGQHGPAHARRRKQSDYARRTAFLASVNETAFLVDKTGNRRYLPVRIQKMPVSWPEEFIEQLWAQAWHRYTTTGVWWPSEKLEAQLEEHVLEFSQENPWADRITSGWAFDADSPDYQRQTATQIHEELTTDPTKPHQRRNPSPAELKDIGHAMAAIWKARGAVENEGQLVVRFGGKGPKKRCNQAGGDNRGWMLPKLRTL